MRVMMHHDAARARGGESPLVCFAQIVARDPFILVGRAANPQFRFADLIGPLVGVATDVPTPWMLLHDDLDRAGVDPAAVKRVMDAPMADNAAALERGDIDVVQVFEPYAEALVSSGRGHVWHRFSVRGGIAFTTFYTTRRFAAKRRNACLALARAMAASLARLHAADPAETAALIGPTFFPDLSPASLARIVSGYREARLWPRGIALPAAAYARLKGALLAGGLIDRTSPMTTPSMPRCANRERRRERRVPAIDIAPFLDGTGKAAVARQVAEACERIGFLVVSGHGIEAAVIERAFERSRAFFDMPRDERTGATRGARPPAGVHGFATRGLAYTLGEETPPDLRETFFLGPVDDHRAHFADLPEAADAYAPNIYPDIPAGTAEALIAIYPRIRTALGRPAAHTRRGAAPAGGLLRRVRRAPFQHSFEPSLSAAATRRRNPASSGPARIPTTAR